MKARINLTPYERLVIVILSITLIAGASVLYIRHSQAPKRIEVVKEGIKEELTLTEVEELLAETRRININTASPKELTLIPGVGEVLASRIAEYRKSNGNFYSEEDLLNVKGIGDKKFTAIKEYIKVE